MDRSHAERLPCQSAIPVAPQHLVPSVSVLVQSKSPTLIPPFKLLRVCWLGLLIAVAHAAPNASLPVSGDAIQRAVLNELNVARTTPMKYVEYLKDQRSRFKGDVFMGTPGVRLVTHEGVVAVDEAIAALSSQAPLDPLKFSAGLALAALDHVRDTGPTGLVSHEGSDGSSSGDRVRRYGQGVKGSGECISYGFAEARQIVMALIIDDGVASRGHRHIIFNGDFHLAGMATGPHKTFKHMCVIDFAGTFTDDPSAIRKRQAK